MRTPMSGVASRVLDGLEEPTGAARIVVVVAKGLLHGLAHVGEGGEVECGLLGVVCNAWVCTC